MVENIRQSNPEIAAGGQVDSRDMSGSPNSKNIRDGYPAQSPLPLGGYKVSIKSNPVGTDLVDLANTTCEAVPGTYSERGPIGKFFEWLGLLSSKTPKRTESAEKEPVDTDYEEESTSVYTSPGSVRRAFTGGNSSASKPGASSAQPEAEGVKSGVESSRSEAESSQSGTESSPSGAESSPSGAKPPQSETSAAAAQNSSENDGVAETTPSPKSMLKISKPTEPSVPSTYGKHSEAMKTALLDLENNKYPNILKFLAGEKNSEGKRVLVTDQEVLRKAADELKLMRDTIDKSNGQKEVSIVLAEYVLRLSKTSEEDAKIAVQSMGSLNLFNPWRVNRHASQSCFNDAVNIMKNMTFEQSGLYVWKDMLVHQGKDVFLNKLDQMLSTANEEQLFTLKEMITKLSVKDSDSKEDSEYVNTKALILYKLDEKIYAKQSEAN